MFGKKASDAGKGLAKERFATIVGERTAIQGDLLLSDSIRVDGHIEGNTRRRSNEAVTVVIGQTGKVTGDIDATRVVVAGTVHGAIRAEEDVELHESAIVDGDVQCRSLHVAHGARLTGRILTSEQPAGSTKPTLVVDQAETPEAAAKRA